MGREICYVTVCQPDCQPSRLHSGHGMLALTYCITSESVTISLYEGAGQADTEQILNIGSYLLCELWDGEGAVHLGTPGCEGGEADHEEVQAGEGDQIDGQLAQVAVQLPYPGTSAQEACLGQAEVVETPRDPV